MHPFQTLQLWFRAHHLLNDKGPVFIIKGFTSPYLLSNVYIPTFHKSKKQTSCLLKKLINLDVLKRAVGWKVQCELLYVFNFVFPLYFVVQQTYTDMFTQINTLKKLGLMIAPLLLVAVVKVVVALMVSVLILYWVNCAITVDVLNVFIINYGYFNCWFMVAIIYDQESLIDSVVPQQNECFMNERTKYCM